MTWAGIALLSWLFGQFPTATEAGRRLVGDAMTPIERVVPGPKEQIGQWVPDLAENPPTSDVSGIDAGPAPRFPGLVRSYFARGGEDGRGPLCRARRV